MTVDCDAQPWSVTALTARIKERLEQGFSRVRVHGEVSRLSRATSGHCYFTIRDAHASISAVIWRSTVLRLRVQPKEGEAFVFSGHLSVYEPRGSYQLVVNGIEMLGEGRLAMELERRKQRMAAEGWFDAAHKRTPPPLPRHVVVVTSPQAAALQDVRKVLRSRPGWLRLSLAPTPVQGEQAVGGIVRALSRAQCCEDVDVILLVRGGGSLEDLWCFNEEAVVRAVAQCRVPVITGIGHETDTTLADLAADLRAATPSNAAELCCPSRDALRHRLPNMRDCRQQLVRRIRHEQDRLAQYRLLLLHIAQREQDARHQHSMRAVHALVAALRNLRWQRLRCLRQAQSRLQPFEPRQRLRHLRRQVYGLRLRLTPLWHVHMQQARSRWYRLDTRLFAMRFEAQRGQVQGLRLQAREFLYRHLMHLRGQWRQIDARLHAMDPAEVLQRGYALVQDEERRVRVGVDGLREGERLHVRLADGSLEVRIERIHRL